MSGPVIVVAILTPRPGRTQDVLASFAKLSPLVHREKGCELYAAHTDGQVVIMIERWTTREDLDAHAGGEPLELLNELNTGLLERPYDVWFLENVAIGDPSKATIPFPLPEMNAS
ncbi:putative quinol monooxygenase [Leifsonia sp. NPDC014704]|uniref:putative quinol monooxygenase n=1 Tax=Leifsonia sp. NPDC014704 TaxID=3364123 RepID=UPI0036F45F00